MKRDFGQILLTTVLLGVSLVCAAQYRGLNIGGSIAIIGERKTAEIYGPGLETRTSKTVNTAFGFKAIYVWDKTRLGFGIFYASRSYKMIRPFDYCAFLKPGEACPEILAHVERYRYATIEIPLSIDIRLFHSNLFSYYIGTTYVHSVYYRSKYDPYFPNTDTKTHDESLNTFSKSIRGQVGITYHPNKKWIVNAQPFITITSKQKGDKILFETPQLNETWWDSFGVTLDVFFKLRYNPKN